MSLFFKASASRCSEISDSVMSSMLSCFDSETLGSCTSSQLGPLILNLLTGCSSLKPPSMACWLIGVELISEFEAADSPRVKLGTSMIFAKRYLSRWSLFSLNSWLLE